MALFEQKCTQLGIAEEGERLPQVDFTMVQWLVQCLVVYVNFVHRPADSCLV